MDKTSDGGGAGENDFVDLCKVGDGLWFLKNGRIEIADPMPVWKEELF